MNNTFNAINNEPKTDPDLAAHFTILQHKGICIQGKPIAEVIPKIPSEDYLNAILQDYKDCLVEIERKPIYCTLNLLRIYLYVKEGKITSKQEAGHWGLENLPIYLRGTVYKALHGYESGLTEIEITVNEAEAFKQYIMSEIE